MEIGNFRPLRKPRLRAAPSDDYGTGARPMKPTNGNAELKKVAELVDARARELEARVSDIDRDISVKLRALERDVANNSSQGMIHTMDGLTWIKRLFWMVGLKMVMLVIVLMWLASLDSRIGLLRDDVSKINTSAQSAIERSTDRFARIEAELRSLRADFDAFQKRVSVK